MAHRLCSPLSNQLFALACMNKHCAHEIEDTALCLIQVISWHKQLWFLSLAMYSIRLPWKSYFCIFFSLSTAMCKQCSQGWIMKCTDTDLLNRIKQKWKWIRTAMSSFVITNQQICSCNRLFCSEKSYTVWAPIKINSTRLNNGFWSRHIKLSLIGKLSTK